MDESNERDLNLGIRRFKGIPFILYLLLHSLLSIIYLTIKLILINHPFDQDINDNHNDNRYESVNDRFLNLGFKQFVNAETIILTCLLTHNISNIWKLTMIYKYKQGFFDTCSKIVCIMSSIFDIAFICHQDEFYADFPIINQVNKNTKNIYNES